jgi:hypothetical protein
MSMEKPGSKQYDMKEMRDYGLGCLAQTKYSSAVSGSTLFDDIKEFHGWEFLTNKIFGLPRNEKYNHVLTHRSGEADK